MGCSPSQEKKYVSTCVIPDTFITFKLIRKATAGDDNVRLFTFATPYKQALSLPLCASLRIRRSLKDGDEEVIRPYTPIYQGNKGEFTILMKIYDDPHPGKLSSWMDKQPIGSKVEFKHVEKDIKLQYPFFGSSGKTGHNVADSITMICGGTGITPMYQALQAVLNYPGDKTQIVLIYGNRTLRDILLKDELDQLETDSNGQLKVVHVIGSKDTTKGSIPEWDGEVGHVSKHHVEKYAHSPKSSTLVFLCGVPGMYETMCGPRTEDELKPGTVLDQLGFKTRQIYKF